MIKSAPFSFVRFEHPAPNDVSLDIPYSLPVVEKHDTLFHFVVSGDRPSTEAIRLGIADTDGNFQRDLVNLATVLSYRYRLAGLLTTAVFDLSFLSVNFVTKTYNQVATPGLLAKILMDDFGVELVDDYFLLPINTNVDIGAIASGNPASFSGVRPALWHEGYAGVTGADVEETGCFTYALLNDSDNAVLGFSNVFRVEHEKAFTTLLSYGSRESVFGFTYNGAGFNEHSRRVNKVRLPFYLWKPEWPTKRVVNRQSTGRTRLLAATVEKQYTLETEHMPEVFHECMRIALSHDDVVMENTNIREIRVEVIEADNYTVAWNDELKLTYAQGKGALKVASFGHTNSNC